AQQAAELVEQLARAVQHAHSRNIIHRDLKPAHVLLTADGTPKLTGFGLFKRIRSDPDEPEEEGQLRGTPLYMAPEQAARKPREVGPHTDVYGLGALLYELLTGRAPFRGATLWDTISQVLEKEPVPPSRLQPEVPSELECICLKCLAK